MIQRIRDNSEYAQRLEQLRAELESFMDESSELPVAEQARQIYELHTSMDALLTEWKLAVGFGVA